MARTALWQAVKLARPDLSDEGVDESLGHANKRQLERIQEGSSFDRSLESVIEELFQPLPSAPTPPESFTPLQRAGVEFTIAVLAAELKRRHGDRANTGIPNEEFLAVWNGVTVTQPIQPLIERIVSDAGLARIDSETRATIGGMNVGRGFTRSGVPS